MPLYEGDTATLTFTVVKASDQTPVSNAAEAEVTVTDPNGMVLSDLKLTTGGVTNLGSGSYQAKFNLGVAGTHKVAIRTTSPANEKAGDLLPVYANPLE